MHQKGLCTNNFKRQIQHADNAYHHQEDEQMHIREGGDKLRNGIVGDDRRQQLRLVYPPKGRLVARQLHPNRVFATCRNNTDIGHRHMIVALNVKRIEGNIGDKFFGLLPDKGE